LTAKWLHAGLKEKSEKMMMLARRSKAIELAESRGFTLDEAKHFPLERVEGFGGDYEDKILVESIDLNEQYENVCQYYRSDDRAKMHCVNYLENKYGKMANPEALDWLLKQIGKPSGSNIFVLCVKDSKGVKRSLILSGELELTEARLSEFQKQVLEKLIQSS